MRFRASLPIAVIVLSILVLAQDVGSPSGAYRRKENASTYHTKGCPFAKSGGWEMVSVTIGEILNGSLQPCSVCHPDKDPAIKGAIDAYRAKKKAEDDAKAAVAAAKATADAAARKSKWPADVSPSKLYRRSTDATTYHTSDCPFAGNQGWVMVAVTPAELGSGKLEPCTVCRPLDNPSIRALVSKATDDARAAAAVAAKAKRDAAAAELRRREAEPLTRLPESRVRSILTAAMTKAQNNVTVFDKETATAFSAVAPDYRGPVTILVQEGLTVLATGPVALLHFVAREATRKFEPMPVTAWSNAVMIGINPTRIDSPDIEKVIVQRNGVTVAPTASSLSLRQLTSSMGAKTQLHAGTVSFPLSAFEPGTGVSVKIILVPATGNNIIRTYGSIDLRAFQ